jgi:hypothetical protein
MRECLAGREHGWVGADQRAAIVGIASSNAALAQIVGPAGTGKSVAAGALAGVWGDLAGGQVHGMAVSEPAANVLISDGVAQLGQHRQVARGAGPPRGRATEAGGPPARGRPPRRDPGRRGVDGADGAAGPDPVDRDSIGARMVLMGDPNQLGASAQAA